MRTKGAALTALLWWSGVAEAAPARVAYVLDGPEDAPLVELFAASIASVGGDVAAEPQIFTGDWTLAGVDAALDAAYAARPDVVMALGLVGSARALHRDKVKIPTIAPWVLDPNMQGLTGPPPANVYPVQVHSGVFRDARTLADVSGADDIGFLIDQAYLQLLQIDPISAPRVFSVGDDPLATVAGIPDAVNGVVVTFLPRLDPDQTTALAHALTERGIASFTELGPKGVEAGFLVSQVEIGDATPIARRAALLTVDVLAGRRPGVASWTTIDPGELVLNGATMAALHVSPSYDVLLQARFVDAVEDDIPSESLDQVVALTVAESPRLAARREEVQASRTEIIRGVSNWLPSVEASVTTQLIDPNYSSVSYGQVAPAMLVGTAKVSQLLYDDKARVLIPINQRRQAAEVAAYDAEALDAVAEVCSAYVDALRAEALLEVRQTDIVQVRSSLQTARVRVSVGDASEAEVARWEAELARARSGLVEAFVTRMIARWRVNQLLGRDPETPFRPDPAEAQRLLDRTQTDPLGSQLSDPAHFQAMVDALVELGVHDSPEIAQLDLGISAQDVWLQATRRAYFIPTFGAQFETSWKMWRSDNGDPYILSVDIDPIGTQEFAFPVQPRAYWTAGIQASIPLFSGRARDADRIEARHDLAALEHRRDQVEQAIALRVRAAAANLQGTWQNVRLSTEAVTGAERTLSWAQDAYGRGLATQIQVLDARQATLQTRLGAADARYRYLAAYLELLRATSTLDHPDRPVDRAAITARVLSLIEETP